MPSKISIIVPIYKVPEQYLRQCIDSLINQSYQNVEIILVDDGSPDDCGRICDEYSAKDSRIKVIHKQNGGLVSARNAGFDVVTGEWHMYLDGDDWIDIDTCEKLIKRVQQEPNIDIVFWKHIQEFDGKQIFGKLEWGCPEKEHIYRDDECKELARNTLIYKAGIATAYCKLIRTDYAKLNDIRHDSRLRQGCEGIEFSFRSFYYANKALFLNEYWNHYLYNPDSISKKGNEANTQYQLDCFNVINEVINGLNEPDTVKESYRQVLYQRICYVLIAIAMSTYFHPNNKESFQQRSKKYDDVIWQNPLYKTAISKASFDGMDNKRKLTIICAKHKLYFVIEIIARAKQFMLKRGKFDY